MWIIIFLELVIFGMAIVAFVCYGKQESEVFYQSRLQLNTTLGVLNAIFVLTSGLFMAAGFQEFKENNKEKSSFISNWQCWVDCYL